MAVGVSGERAKEVIGEGWARILCVGFTVEDDWVIAEKCSADVRQTGALQLYLQVSWNLK
jgi:hypothetical protein